MNRFKSSKKVESSKYGNNTNSPKTSYKSVTSAPVVSSTEQPRGLLRTLAESAVMGAGATIGSRVVDAVMGPRTIQIENKQNTSGDNCSGQYTQFYQCVKNGSSECDNILSDKCKQDKN